MKVLLLDPKLLNRRGHHFHTDLAIYEECKARDIPIEILGNRKVAPAILPRLPVRPVFATSTYPSCTSPHDLRSDWATVNRMVEQDLKEGCDAALGPEDAVLVPSARDSFLGGIFRWYSTLPEPRPHICLRLLFEPGFDAKKEGPTRAVALTAAFVEEQMRAWASLPADKLSLVAERHALAVHYQRICDFPVTVLPMPVRYPPASVTGALALRSDRHAPHIVFLGEGRHEKGFHLLPDAFRDVLAKHPEIRLTLQTSRRFDISPDDVQSLRALSPNVSILRGPLSVEEYDDLLFSSDIVLVAYNPESYALRTSQIFLEAVGAGKVALTTRGTWMQQEAEKLGLANIYVDEFTSAGVASATQHLLRNWPAAADRAQRAAPRVRQHHNPARFVDGLLRVIGGCGHAAGSEQRGVAGRC